MRNVWSGVRLWAVAAVAVAGVLGWVGTVAAGIDGGELVATATDQAVISISIPLEGSIWWVGNGTYDETKLGDSVMAYKETNPGNLGMVKIKTNAERWDVTFKTEHGGRLFASGGKAKELSQKDPTCVPSILSPCDMWYADVDGEYMYYKDTSNTADSARLKGISGAGRKDTVILEMSIGAAGYIDIPTYTGYHTLGAEKKNTIAPTRVRQSKLKASWKADSSVSFAECFSDDATEDYTKLIKLLESRPNWSGKFVSADDLKTKGFPTPDKDQEEYFYVNVGIGQRNYPKIKKVANKTYTETITFNLVVNW